MRFRVKYILIALFLLGPSVPAFAGNEHEHLQYLPRYSDIELASESKLGSLPASEVLPDQISIIEDRYGPTLLSEERFRELRQTKSLSEFCDAISAFIPGTSTETILRGFFELKPTHVNAMGSYLSSTQIRNRLFRAHPEWIEPAVTAFLHTTPKVLNLKSVYSIPDYLLKPSLLKNLIHEFERGRMQAQFYLSIPRAKLASRRSDYPALLEKVKVGVKEGWMNGIDLTGSIGDLNAAYKNPERVKLLMEQRMIELFKASHDSRLGVRIHAFENGTTGAFYDAFWSALEKCKNEKCLPSRLRIGHIQDLDLDAIKKLSRYAKGMDLVFEANIESNIQLVESEIKKLSTQIEMLHQNGLRVALGSDGAGILGDASRFDVTVLRLRDAGLNKRSIRKILEESFTPLKDTRLRRIEIDRWWSKMQEMNTAINEFRVTPERPQACSPRFLQTLRGLFRFKYPD